MQRFIIFSLVGLAALAGDAVIGLNCRGLWAAGPAPAARPAPLQLDDVPATLTTRRTPAEQDRLEAMAMFATARRMEDSNPDRALRLYQRAFQLDPDSSSTADAIAILAFKQKRVDEGVRYALVAAELFPTNPMLLERLAAHLIQENRLKESLHLLNKVVELQPADERQTALYIDLLMKRGRIAFILDESKLAADSFLQVLAALDEAEKFGLTSEIRSSLLGDAAKTYTMFGETFLKASKLDDAREAFQTAYLVERDKPGHAYNMARVELAAGNAQQAEQELQTYFKSKSTSQGSSPYSTLADILKSAKKEQEVLPTLEKMHKAEPGNLFLTFALAEQYQQADQWDKASPLFENVLQEAPSEPRYAFVQQSSARTLVEELHERKSWKPLLDSLGRVVALAGALDPVEKQIEPVVKDKAAMEALLKVARQVQKTGMLSTDEQLAIALIALEGKQFAEANRYFQQVVDNRPASAAPVYLAWGIGLLVGEQNDESVKVFRQALERKVLPEDNPAFQIYLASALAYAKQTEEALKVIDRAIELDSDNPRLQGRKAWIYYQAKQYDQARAAYERMLAKFGEDYESSEVRDVVREARLVLSNIEVQSGTMPAAEEWLQQVLDEFPQDVSALNDLGYLWADQGKHLNRALRMTQYAVSQDPENDAYRDSLGWALYRLGRYEEALPHLQHAAAVDSPDGVILDHLADIYWALHQKEDALANWKRAVEAFDKQKDAAKSKAVQEKIIKAEK